LEKALDYKTGKLCSFLLLLSCFLFVISFSACGRRGDPVLPSYDAETPDQQGEERGEPVIKVDPSEVQETEPVRPNAPVGIFAVFTGKSIVLSWEDVLNQGVKMYNVYRSSGEAYNFIGHTAAPAYTDRDIKPGMKYYYKITAVGQSESPLSGEILVLTEN
jgi:predicted small lipoprotein YifL